MSSQLSRRTFLGYGAVAAAAAFVPSRVFASVTPVATTALAAERELSFFHTHTSERLSTAYLPGCKFTMLPEDVIERFSLDHGGEQPALSLYFDVSEHDGSVRGTYSRIERVPIAANLRHAEYDVLNEAFESGTKAGLPFEGELRTLWSIAGALEARRGRPSIAPGHDYVFHLEQGRVRIVPRKRGAPLDKLVSEMMIFVNSTWGELLAEHDVAAIYRVQSTGKVRLSVHPEAHEGLGVGCYAWMSSPLRRYPQRPARAVRP